MSNPAERWCVYNVLYVFNSLATRTHCTFHVNWCELWNHRGAKPELSCLLLFCCTVVILWAGCLINVFLKTSLVLLHVFDKHSNWFPGTCVESRRREEKSYFIIFWFSFIYWYLVTPAEGSVPSVVQLLTVKGSFKSVGIPAWTCVPQSVADILRFSVNNTLLQMKVLCLIKNTVRYR